MANLCLDDKTVLITGVAGFIGSNLARRLLRDYKKIKIIGIDNLNDYYDVKLKEYRLSYFDNYENFTFIRKDISNKDDVFNIFKKYKPNIVVNLAAQAGVRYSIINPDAYIQSNVVGFYNILEACRKSYEKKDSESLYVPVEHMVYASSSSVYGLNKKIPYSIDDNVDNPVSLYAATKKSNELFAHCYSKLYGIPTTGLRFFTVYGPAGRPDMAYFSFTNKLINNEMIKIFNYGNCKRDFTYIDDIIEGLVNIMKKSPSTNINGVPYKVYNIGNNHPEKLLDFVKILQEELLAAKVLPNDYNFEKHKELVPMQPGDVEITYADVSELEKDFGFKPSTPLKTGLKKFVQWYKSYYL